MIFFFFFQAEDGIRDHCVTGVQTCALPILEHTIEDQGMRLIVEPKIVLEVAFNNMMRSDRHNSGFALRFPRIVRLRPDKPTEEADAIERVREIYQQQSGTEALERTDS